MLTNIYDHAAIDAEIIEITTQSHGNAGGVINKLVALIHRMQKMERVWFDPTGAPTAAAMSDRDHNG